jgi:HK97 family phage portal protein
MKLPKILSNIFNPRASPKNSSWYRYSPYKFLFGSTLSGKSVNERTAMQTTTVYACVRILAETIASLPLHTYKYTERGKEKAINHELYYLLHDEPNPEMTSFVFRETLMSHLLLWGNAFAQIIRDGNNRILALYPLLPDKMTVIRNDNDEIYYVYNKDGILYKLGYDEVLHIPGLAFDGLVGYSPIAVAKNAVGMALATEEYGSKFFANDARPSVVLQHPGILKSPSKVRESWNSIYQGSGNSSKVAVLEEGMDIKTLSIPPEAAQFLETRKFQVEEICRMFRVPPHLVASLDRATFSNIENQSIEFVVYTLDSWLVRWEMAIKKALFTKEEKKKYFVKFNTSALMRGDYASRMSGYATGIQNGFLSPNDVRTLENLNTVENGDTLMVNGNMLKLEDVGAYANKNGGDSNK